MKEQQDRVAELERGLRCALRRWKALTDTQRDYMGEPYIMDSNDSEAVSYRNTVMILKGLAQSSDSLLEE